MAGLNKEKTMRNKIGFFSKGFNALHISYTLFNKMYILRRFNDLVL